MHSHRDLDLGEYELLIERLVDEHSEEIADGRAYDVATWYVPTLHLGVDNGTAQLSPAGDGRFLVNPFDIVHYSDTQAQVPEDEVESLSHRAALILEADMREAYESS